MKDNHPSLSAFTKGRNWMSVKLRNVSVNAHNGLERKGTINEFQADYYVRKCQDNTPDELRNFLEGIDHDALTK